jgi:hypothetical protein
VLFEGVVCESPVVCMVLLDSDAVISGESLESLFCFDCLGGGEGRHQMNVAEAREMVDKDGGSLVSFGGETSFELGDKTRLG